MRLLVKEVLKFVVGWSERGGIKAVFVFDVGEGLLNSDKPSLSISPSILVMERYSRSAARELKSMFLLETCPGVPLIELSDLVFFKSKSLLIFMPSGGDGGSGMC